jgi:uncharacterized protein YgiM (DUF1202 family)
MGNDEEWEYHHTTDSGYKVNEDGYDKNGTSHKYDVRPSSSNSSSGSSGGFDESQFEARFMLITAQLAILGLFGYLLYKINLYLLKNWLTVATVLGAFIICAIACFFIIHKGVRQLILKIILAILASIGLMYAGLSFGPKIGETFNNLQSYSYSPEELAAIQEKKTILYGYVTADVLVIRAEPFALAEVIGQFSKDDRIEITDDSNSWWLEVKFEDGGGYVESSYVRLE